MTKETQDLIVENTHEGEQPDYKQLQKIIDMLPHAEMSQLDFERTCGGANEKCPKCLLQAYITQRPIARLEKEKEEAESRLYEIRNLCENCRSLCDAQYIAHGRKDTSTESGCDKCWVQRECDKKKKLQALLAERDAEIERLKRKLAEGFLIDYDVLDIAKPQDILAMIEAARRCPRGAKTVKDQAKDKDK